MVQNDEKMKLKFLRKFLWRNLRFHLHTSVDQMKRWQKASDDQSETFFSEKQDFLLH